MRRSAREGLGADGLGRLAWIGLILAAIGWALLLAKAALADLAAVRGAPLLAGALRDDVGEIARCLIGSGFALAVIGCLQNGFGALNRFFETVLARSGARAVQPPPTGPAMGPSMAAAMADGPIHDARPYRTFPDGSVEVETILGTRRFTTMAQARDFI